MIAPDIDLSLDSLVLEQEENQKRKQLFDFAYHNGVKRRKRYFFNERKIVTNRIDDLLPDNSIRASKYNFWNFIPKHLWEQLSKKPNLYFVAIGILQSIPQISISNGIPGIFFPLTIILIVTGLKDFFENLLRKKRVREENMQKVMCLEENELKEKHWENLRVGNIIKVECDECIPADLVLLQTSEKKGICYLETKNLDGETNLKTKILHKELGKIFNKNEFKEAKAMFQYERPNPYLYKFSGIFKHDEAESYNLDFSNFLIRGSTLKNTKFIFGLVVYTGHETKVMMNIVRSSSKKSALEKKMEAQILIIFLIQILLCLFCSVTNIILFFIKEDELSYLQIPNNISISTNFILNLGNWMLLFTNLIPISLLVTLETVKFIQGKFIMQDFNINEKKDCVSVQTSNLNEELGQIKFIFSDKTGTLTCNKMEFRAITIKGKPYGSTGEGCSDELLNDFKLVKLPNVSFFDSEFFGIIRNPHHLDFPDVKEAILLLALCHTVGAENKPEGLFYNSASPDEIAMVNFSRFCGFEYFGLDDNNNICVNYMNKRLIYKLLYVFEFDGERKRQSVIIQKENNEIYLYCKGADSTMENLLDTHTTKSKIIFERTWSNMHLYAERGFRTLILAEKKLDPSEFALWQQKYEYARKLNRVDLITELQEEIEKELQLIGVTAIEDKLQDEVKLTIQTLKESGIKVWVMTGDKIETAIYVGYSSGLIESDMNRFIVDQKTELKIEENLDKILEEISKETNMNSALIIHGEALLHIIMKPFLLTKMIKIINNCSSVLGCRLTPKQKEEMVSLVKKQFKDSLTLAIGDGANDVNMITSAHVGIGISGLEGNQATRASDYAISEFKHLSRLLLLHGRECYRRNANLVCFNFFKNILLVLPQLWFAGHSQFSGQSLYESIIYQFYNIFYTSVPIIIYSTTDQEFPSDVLLKHKIDFYSAGPNCQFFNPKTFWIWILEATITSSLVHFSSLYSLEQNFVGSDGFSFNFWGSGFMIFALCVVIANLKILFMCNRVNLFLIFWIFVTIGSFWESEAVFERFRTSDCMGREMGRTFAFYLGGIAVVMGWMGLEIFRKMLREFKGRTIRNEMYEEIRSKNVESKTRAEKFDGIEKSVNFMVNSSSPEMKMSDFSMNKSYFDKINSKEGRFAMSNIIKTTRGDIVKDFINSEHIGFAFSKDNPLDSEKKPKNNETIYV